MSVQLMQHLLRLQVEHFQRTILKLNPDELSQDIIAKCLLDKFMHLEEENIEVNKAVSLFEPENITTYYEIIDGYVDVVYVILAIKWISKYIALTPTQEHILKSNYTLLKNIRRLLPPEIPYAYAFNLVHKANMAKIPGKKPGRTMLAGYDAIKPSGWKEPDWHTFCQRHFFQRRNKKTLILGDAQSGKDTYASYLHYWYGHAFVPAFNVYGPYIRKELETMGIRYTTFRACYNDRVNHRGLWYNLIRQYNEKDEAQLAKDILVKSDIYPGIRSIVEAEATAELFDRVIFICAGNRVPPESSDSNQIDLNIAKRIFGNKLETIDNNGTLIQFVLRIWKAEQKYE